MLIHPITCIFFAISDIGCADCAPWRNWNHYLSLKLTLCSDKHSPSGIEHPIGLHCLSLPSLKMCGMLTSSEGGIWDFCTELWLKRSGTWNRNAIKWFFCCCYFYKWIVHCHKVYTCQHISCEDVRKFLMCIFRPLPGPEEEKKFSVYTVAYRV